MDAEWVPWKLTNFIVNFIFSSAYFSYWMDDSYKN